MEWGTALLKPSSGSRNYSGPAHLGQFAHEFKNPAQEGLEPTKINTDSILRENKELLLNENRACSLTGPRKGVDVKSGH